MNNNMKLFFIIGMRRSGTSILKDLMTTHPEISGIEFEPHPLWNAVDLLHFSRFKSLPYVSTEISRFKLAGKDKWYGAKFALNPGTKAMEWIWLPMTFPGSKIIFILRNRESTYKSYYKQDVESVRGYIPEDIYNPFFDLIINGFERYHEENPKDSVFVNFENLVENPDAELDKAWKILNIEIKTGHSKMMRQPEFWSKK